MADHSFDPDVAEQVGVTAAILYKNISHWCEKNELNGRNIHDGRAWTYNSRSAFLKQFPYLSDKTLPTALARLEEAKYIVSGVFNKDSRDRTKWYADLRKCIVPKGPMDNAERANVRTCQKGQPLPNNKTNNTPYSPPFEKFWEVFADRRGKAGAWRVWQRKKLNGKSDEVLLGAAQYVQSRGDDKRYWKQAQGWLNDERWLDEPAQASGKQTIHDYQMSQIPEVM